MERTQRLLAIAAAVLALDGCRGGSQQANRPNPQPTSTSSHLGGTHISGGHSGGGFVGGAAAGGAMAGAASRSRTLGGDRGSTTSADGESRGGYGSHGFGEAGAHGAGG